MAMMGWESAVGWGEGNTLPSCVRCKLTSRRYTFRSRVPSDLRENNREIQRTTRVPRSIDTRRYIPVRSTPRSVRSHPRPQPRRTRRNLPNVRRTRFRSKSIVLDLAVANSVKEEADSVVVEKDSVVVDLVVVVKDSVVVDSVERAEDSVGSVEGAENSVQKVAGSDLEESFATRSVDQITRFQ